MLESSPVTVDNMGKVCRVCLQEADAGIGRILVDIFQSDGKLPRVSVVKCLREICSLEISEHDQYSKLICSLCQPRLQNAFFIRSLALRSQEKLHQVLTMASKAQEDSGDEENINFEHVQFEDHPSSDNSTEEGPAKRKYTKGSKVDDIVCCVCEGKTFRSQRALNIHSIREHRPERDDITKRDVILCNVCYVPFEDEEAAKLHQQINPNVRPLRKCNYCRCNLKSIQDLEWHWEKHHADRLFKCCGCDFSSGYQAELVRHSRVHKLIDRNICNPGALAADKKYQCVICFTRFNTLHGQRVHEISPYKVDDYSLASAQHVNQPEQQAQQIDKKPELVTLKCSLCNEEYTQNINASGHQVHKCAATFKCRQCFKEYGTLSGAKRCLGRHRTLKWRGNKIPAKNARYNCTLCPRVLATSLSLRRHMTTHFHREYQCRYCPAVFLREPGRRNHEIRHTKQSRYRCEVCGKRTNHRQRYIAHHESKHTTEADRVFACDHCPQRFSKDHFLSNHINWVHRMVPSDGDWNSKFYEQNEGFGAKALTTGDAMFENDESNDSANNDQEFPVPPPQVESAEHQVEEEYEMMQDAIDDNMSPELVTLKCSLCNEEYTQNITSIGQEVHECSVTFNDEQYLVEYDSATEVNHSSKRQQSPQELQELEIPDEDTQPEENAEHHSIVTEPKRSVVQRRAAKKREAEIPDTEESGVASVRKRSVKRQRSPVKRKTETPTEFKCTLCPRVLKTAVSLKIHLVTHTHREFPCRYCPTVFLREAGRRNHEIRHTEQSQYMCEVCGVRTNHRGRYIAHHESKHTTEATRVFACDHCPQRFSKDHFLSNHIHWVHRLTPSDGDWNSKFHQQAEDFPAQTSTAENVVRHGSDDSDY